MCSTNLPILICRLGGFRSYNSPEEMNLLFASEKTSATDK